MITSTIGIGCEAAREASGLPSDGETAVLACLVAVPVIWTALIMGMLGYAAASIEAALLVAMPCGVAGGALRRVWLARRHVDDDHPAVPHRLHPIG